MKTKRILYFIISVALLCLLAACGGSGNGENDTGRLPGGGEETGSPSLSPSPSPPLSTGEGGGSDPTSTPEPTTEPTNAPTTDTAPTAEPTDAPTTEPTPGGEAGAVGSASDLLAAIIEALTNVGAEMPISSPPMPIPEGESQNAVGLSQADIDRYVTEIAQSMAMIGTFAHQIVVYQCNDANAASQVKSLISSNGGYDSQKWICVFPEKTVAVDSGSYVLLVASYRAVADAALDVFGAIAGSTGAVVTIYEGPV